MRLSSKGISFGTLIHNSDGGWDASKVEGISAPSLTTAKSAIPSLVIRPFHQVGNIVSVRQFTNNAFNTTTSSNQKSASDRDSIRTVTAL